MKRRKKKRKITEDTDRWCWQTRSRLRLTKRREDRGRAGEQGQRGAVPWKKEERNAGFLFFHSFRFIFKCRIFSLLASLYIFSSSSYCSFHFLSFLKSVLVTGQMNLSVMQWMCVTTPFGYRAKTDSSISLSHLWHNLGSLLKSAQQTQKEGNSSDSCAYVRSVTTVKRLWSETSSARTWRFSDFLRFFTICPSNSS